MHVGQGGRSATWIGKLDRKRGGGGPKNTRGRGRAGRAGLGWQPGAHRSFGCGWSACCGRCDWTSGCARRPAARPWPARRRPRRCPPRPPACMDYKRAWITSRYVHVDACAPPGMRTAWHAPRQHLHAPGACPRPGAQPAGTLERRAVQSRAEVPPPLPPGRSATPPVPLNTPVAPLPPAAPHTRTHRSLPTPIPTPTHLHAQHVRRQQLPPELLVHQLQLLGAGPQGQVGRLARPRHGAGAQGTQAPQALGSGGHPGGGGGGRVGCRCMHEMWFGGGVGIFGNT